MFLICRTFYFKVTILIYHQKKMEQLFPRRKIILKNFDFENFDFFENQRKITFFQKCSTVSKFSDFFRKYFSNIFFSKKKLFSIYFFSCLRWCLYFKVLCLEWSESRSRRLDIVFYKTKINDFINKKSFTIIQYHSKNKMLHDDCTIAWRLYIHDIVHDIVQGV